MTGVERIAAERTRQGYCRYCGEAGVDQNPVTYPQLVQQPGANAGELVFADEPHRSPRTLAYWAAIDGTEAVMEQFGATREEVIVACWWAALYGPTEMRHVFGTWVSQWSLHLHSHCGNVPNPPTIDEWRSYRPEWLGPERVTALDVERIHQPLAYGTVEVICNWDNERWPCHAIQLAGHILRPFRRGADAEEQWFIDALEDAFALGDSPAGQKLRRAAARTEVGHYLARAWQAVGDDPALRQALTEGLRDVSERLAVRELHANPPGPGVGCSNIPDQPTKEQRR